MSNNPNYYAIIPANVRYDKTICANAKLLYGEITALCNKEGFCWASNDYFSDLYNVSLRTISRWITSLKNSGFITVFLNENSNQERRIFIAHPTTKMSIPTTKMSTTHDKNVYPSIYSINNTINTVGNPLNFILEKYPIRFEQEFLMVFEKEFKSQKQFETFLTDFNDEAEMKERTYGSWLIPMLKKYCRKWLDFQGRMRVIKNEDYNNKQANKHLDAAI